MTEREKEWGEMSPEEKKRALYLKQKKMMDDFLARGALSPAQYRKSLDGLTEKMGLAGLTGSRPENDGKN